MSVAVAPTSGAHTSGPPAEKDAYLRTACPADAAAIHKLILEHLAEGHLLPRDRDEISRHSHRFVIAVLDGRVTACAELAPLSHNVAEVRSLAVGRHTRSLGLGARLVDELVERARVDGFEKLCAFTHAPSYFVRLGFSIVPHVWLPEKILTDCHACPHFRRCGQYAVMLEPRRARRTHRPEVAFHG
jgi:N-acetylglutamate synthase-like GNAT family acetyltransferase